MLLPAALALDTAFPAAHPPSYDSPNRKLPDDPHSTALPDAASRCHRGARHGRSGRPGLLAPSATNCASQELDTVFRPWLDPANYPLAPGGSFEAGTQSWDLRGAAGVSGNERYYVTAASDRSALRIGGGGQAVSPTTCVGIEHPTIRFFARNVGSPLGTLRVDVLFHGPLGLPVSAPIGVVAGGGSWQPDLPMPIVASLLPLLPGERTPVAFRVTAQGLGAAYEIDDFYVDPYRKS